MFKCFNIIINLIFFVMSTRIQRPKKNTQIGGFVMLTRNPCNVNKNQLVPVSIGTGFGGFVSTVSNLCEMREIGGNAHAIVLI